MDKGAAALKFATWEQLIIEANNSGLKKREWCAQHGIEEKTFYYWQRKIRAKTLETMKALDQSGGDTLAAPRQEQTLSLTQTQSSFIELSFQETAPVVSAAPSEPAVCDAVLREAEPHDIEPIHDPVPTSPAAELVLQIDGCSLFIHDNIKEQTLATVLRVLRDA